MLEFENNSTSENSSAYLNNLNNCFNSNKIVYPWEYPIFNNTCLPTIINKNKQKCKNNNIAIETLPTTIEREAIYANILSQFPIGSIMGLLALGAEYIMMLDICTNSYIVAPHEQINLELGLSDCQSKNGKIINTAKNALTIADVPFYYHCDPNYDPTNKKNLDTNKQEDIELIGKTWGYMGKESQYCTGKAAKYARKKMIGKVIVHYISGWERFLNGLKDRCQMGGYGNPTRNQIILDTKKDKYLYPTYYHAYYNFNEETGKIQMCVVTPWTLLPIKIGCTYIAPPNEGFEIDEKNIKYLQNTRCYYFITGRHDLKSLGKILPKNDEDGHLGISTKEFLTSDLHIMSTVVGCIEDILKKIFTKNKNFLYRKKTILEIMQENLHNLILATLVLYITIIGIKLLTANEIPNRSEIIIYLIKFILVLYFSLGTIWYKSSLISKKISKENNEEGLYTILIKTTMQIAEFFLSIHNKNTMELCKYKLHGKELLSNRQINISHFNNNLIKPTMGRDSTIQMTFWDLLDCKLINYINLGSCKYSISGIISIWIITAAFFSGIKGFMLSIITFIYCLTLLMIIFKLIHIFIVSILAITILILISPIFITFVLFKFTNRLFYKWISLLLGYIIHPGLFFAFITIILTIFDSIYFGNIYINKKEKLNTKTICKNIDSIYCATYSLFKSDPCLKNIKTIEKKLIKKINFNILGSINIMPQNIINIYLNSMLKLTLYTLLTYMFINSISKFISTLTKTENITKITNNRIIEKISDQINKNLIKNKTNNIANLISKQKYNFLMKKKHKSLTNSRLSNIVRYNSRINNNNYNRR